MFFFGRHVGAKFIFFAHFCSSKYYKFWKSEKFGEESSGKKILWRSRHKNQKSENFFLLRAMWNSFDYSFGTLSKYVSGIGWYKFNGQASESGFGCFGKEKDHATSRWKFHIIVIFFCEAMSIQRCTIFCAGITLLLLYMRGF